MNIEKLPKINIVVSAKCWGTNGKVETHLIRIIKTKDTAKGWQWSHAEIKTYFTLEVISWENL